MKQALHHAPPDRHGVYRAIARAPDCVWVAELRPNGDLAVDSTLWVGTRAPTHAPETGWEPVEVGWQSRGAG